MKIRKQVKHRKQAFTLIELIVVMGIVGILAAGGLAAFTLTAKSGRVDQAREVISTAVRSARSYAVSNNRNVILVFNTNLANVHDPSVRDERGFRSMAVFDPVENDYVTDWMNMPGGIFFQPLASSQKGQKTDILSLSKKIAYETAQPSMPWIWIKSDGTLPAPQESLKPYAIRIEEGIPGTGPGALHAPGTPSNPRHKEIQINWLNGSIATFDASAGDRD